ncbi:hypothetical protein [Sphingorhabdus sp.]|jgi:hypothetical protein|uniref:hypothetical protein n=1 Tax=Sphingorhabdus sp. TaxID=1902408 RepID=UPI003D81937F
MQIVDLTNVEIENVAGGPFFLGFIAGFKAAKVGVTLAAAAFGVGGASAIAALENDD